MRQEFVDKDDEAKALTRQITGHKDLLSNRDPYILVFET